MDRKKENEEKAKYRKEKLELKNKYIIMIQKAEEQKIKLLEEIKEAIQNITNV